MRNLNNLEKTIVLVNITLIVVLTIISLRLFLKPSVPIEFQNHKVEFVKVYCNKTYIREGFLSENTTDYFIVRNFLDFKYPKNKCSYNTIKVTYK